LVRPRQIADQEILTIARRCFLKLGPSVSTAVIASEVGLSQAALFKRFGTKNELMLRALLPPEVPAWLGILDGGPTADPIPDQLRAVGLAMSAFYLEMVPCISTLRAAVDMAEAMRKAYDEPPPLRARRALQGWFQAGIDAGRIRGVAAGSAAEAFIGALHGRAFLGHISGDLSLPEAFVNDLVDLTWRGMAPTERS
jgi:AcrR family transcriptional regulator